MTYPPVLLTAPRSSGLCTICEDVLINVGESLTRPVTEDTMKSLLNTACGMMPQYLQQTVRSCYFYQGNVSMDVTQTL